MTEPKDPPIQNKDIGFPSIEWEDEQLATRPMPLHERPLQARIDREMAVVAAQHIRIAIAIENMWGHKECLEYIQSLVLSGYKEGQKRMGFKPEVLAALMNLATLHETDN